MLKGRHRPVRVRLRLLLAELVELWPLALAVVVVVLAAIAIGAAANAEPPPTTLGVTSAQIGIVAGNPGAAPVNTCPVCQGVNSESCYRCKGGG